MITAAAERLEGQLAGILYLDAMMPENGQTAVASMGVGPPADLALPVPPVEMFQIASEADRTRVAALMTPDPTAPIAQPLRTMGAAMRVSRRMYILAAGYARQSPGFLPMAEKLARIGGWTIKRPKCGHHVMMDETALVVESLIELAD